MVKVKKEKKNKVYAYLSFTLPDELKADLLKLAEAEGRKLATYIKVILNKHLRRKGIK